VFMIEFWIQGLGFGVTDLGLRVNSLGFEA